MYSTAAHKMSKLKGFMQNVDGILFYGGLNDGNVIVVYNLDLINLSRYAIESPSNRFKTYNDIKWYPLKNIIGYKLNNQLDKNQLNSHLLDLHLMKDDDIIKYANDKIQLNDDKFKQLSDKLKIEYIKKAIDEKSPYSHIWFEYATKELKIQLIDEYFINKSKQINDEMFDILPDVLKDKYLLFSAELYHITPHMFKYDDRIKRRYINYIIKNNYELKSEYFVLLDDKMKRNHIQRIVNKKHLINNDIFNDCFDELKNYYINYILTNKFILTDTQFNFCNKKEEYIEYALLNHFELSDNIFNQLKFIQKVRYIKYCIKNKITFYDDKWNFYLKLKNTYFKNDIR